jgi:hypothetical protein
VPEWPNGRDWKSRDGRKLVRGFESLPLRWSAGAPLIPKPTVATGVLCRHGADCEQDEGLFAVVGDLAPRLRRDADQLVAAELLPDAIDDQGQLAVED